jgi:putative transferase (TIGR04331 family)
VFLALTALSDWWEKDAEILLLGPWCAPYDKREELESLTWRMLSSPWEDRQRLHAASAYADTVYQRLLLHLSAHMNRVLGVQEPLAHWRLLIGPWLLHFVHAVYDRHAHLSDALLCTPGLRTAVLSERCFRTPRTTKDGFTWITQDDHYNWQLFSELLSLMKKNTVRHACVVSPTDAVVTATSTLCTPRLGRYVGRGKAHVLRAVSSVLRAMSSGRCAWLTEVTTSRASLLGLAVRSGFRVVPVPVSDVLRAQPSEPIWDERRMTLGDFPVLDDFEAICARMLPRHLPTIYLEGYHHARRTIRRQYPRMPSLLASETGWYFNETYKYLVAEAFSHGARLVTIQHGGYYGYARSTPAEAFERAIGHTFFVWGWADGQPSLRNVPHPIVSRYPRRFRTRSTRILFAPNVAERYLHRLGSTAAGSMWEPQWQWQDRFVGALPAPLRRQVTLRPPPYDFGQGVRQRLCDRYPEIAIDGCARFKQSVARSRLTILERPGTCVLESLAMNGPTVLFWDPTLWDFRNEAAPYLAALRRVGILWDSPELAAAHVAAVYDDPAAWWNSEAVQTARGAFAERFALARRDWVDCWVRALREELTCAGEKARPAHPKAL